MTTAATSETAKQPEAAAAPQVNIQEIVTKAADAAAKAAGEAATKVAEQKATEVAGRRMQEIGRELAGDKAVDPAKQFLESFVSAPDKLLHGLKEVTKREIREEYARADEVARTQRDVVGPVVKEYPGLNSPNKLALVERLAEQHQANGLSYADALKKAADDTVKEFGLKSVTEEAQNGRVVALPNGGAAFIGGAPKYDEGKSNSDFLAGMKGRMNAFRKKSA
jgi:hypothetical protein